MSTHTSDPRTVDEQPRDEPVHDRSTGLLYGRIGRGVACPWSPEPSSAARQYLQTHNTRLTELRSQLTSEEDLRFTSTKWRTAPADDLNLLYFRADNAYIWQQRTLPTLSHYSGYVRYLRRGLISPEELPKEQGEFGCWHYAVNGLTVSRPLLDSANELSFLEKLDVVRDRTILDIGAGYGRLASHAWALRQRLGFRHWLCTDVIPESAFLAQYWLQRTTNGDRVTWVPPIQLDDIEVDVAIAIHVFSELPLVAVRSWLEFLARTRVDTLVVVPNETNGPLTFERNGDRLPTSGLFEEFGYSLRVVEPYVSDPDVNCPDVFQVYSRGPR